MSRSKGVAASGWVAAYLRRWWPNAEKTPNGLPGADITGTPGVAFEIKTGATWREAWLKQAKGYADGDGIWGIVYLPPGISAANVANAQFIIPLYAAMQLLTEAGYAPDPDGYIRLAAAGED